MKRSNFLNLGITTVLLTAGLVLNSASANTNFENIESTISNEIHQLIKENYDKGFLKENYKIDVQIAKPKKIMMSDGESEFPASLGPNAAHIIKNSCKIALSFFQDGSGQKLGGESEFLEVTKFQNENQKKIVREFFALHESFHCELADVENPIRVPGSSKEFNEKINYYIKDLQSESDGNGKASYFGMLSETFGDIGATGLLLKKYGTENTDLQFVLTAIQTQRHADYFRVSNNNHFTHLGMEDVLNNNTAKKLIEAKDGNEYRDVVLQIANKSVQQLITQRKDIAEDMFSKEKLKSSIGFHLTHEILNNSKNSNQNQDFMELFRKPGTERGFVRDIVSDFFQGEEEHLNGFKNISSNKQKDIDRLSKYVVSLYESKNKIVFENKDIDKFDQYITEFKEIVFKQNNSKVIEFDNVGKEDAVNKMMALRDKFLESTRSNSSKLGIK